jgi:hypothetical protein
MKCGCKYDEILSLFFEFSPGGLLPPEYIQKGQKDGFTEVLRRKNNNNPTERPSARAKGGRTRKTVAGRGDYNTRHMGSSTMPLGG